MLPNESKRYSNVRLLSFLTGFYRSGMFYGDNLVITNSLWEWVGFKTSKRAQ